MSNELNLEELERLAEDFQCHPLSRGIDDIERAGIAMQVAKDEIERLRSLAIDRRGAG